MKLSNTLLAAAITLSAPNLAHAATVELKNLYASVEIVPEDRSDVAVDMRAADGKLRLPSVTRVGDTVIVDGGLRPLLGCNGGGDPEHGANAPGHGWLGRGSAINLTVHTPRDVRVKANGSIIGTVRAAGQVDLTTNGCSHWRIADVAGALSIHQDGAAHIEAGSAGSAHLDLSGFSNVDLAAARALNVDMSGAGKVSLGRISGPVDASLSGVGSVKIASGHAQRVKAEVSGLGGFSLRGSAAELDADVSGIGSVHVDHVDGAVHKSVSGIGHVSVGR
jgi:hypothetical protein